MLPRVDRQSVHALPAFYDPGLLLVGVDVLRVHRARSDKGSGPSALYAGLRPDWEGEEVP
jgi:hypothetical protein